MEQSPKRLLIAPLTLSITIALAGCEGSDPGPDSASNDTTSTSAAQPSFNGSATENQQATTQAGQSDSAAVSGSLPADADTTAVGLAAISTAESAAGGQAYQIDDRNDDKTWEVDVRIGLGSVEVTVSGDGTQVYSQGEGGLDDDLHAALAGATITLSEAIQIAVEDSGGMLREVELEDATDAAPHHWEVSLNTGQPTDTEVSISMTGEVIEVHN